MSLSEDRMIYWLRKELGGLDDSDLSDVDALELLNMSLWSLEDTFPFKAKETVNTSIPLVEGTSSYSLASITRLDAITSVSIRLSADSNNEGHKLARMTRDWYDANYVGGEDARALPTRYMREGNLLYVYPDPNADYAGLALRIAHRQGIASIIDGATSSGLPRNWDEIVMRGAVWRAHNANGDYNLAQQATNFQLGLIRQAITVEAKEERDSRYARVNVIHEFPEEELEGHEG